jgi:PAS domain-containing protein
MADEQHPIEIILARGLMSNLTTPAFLVDVVGTLVYFNDAAADILGLRFEEAGPLPPQDWGTRFVPRDESGARLDVPDLPLSVALATGQPAHGRMWLHTAAGEERRIEVHALPIVGSGGMRGALAIFWDIPDGP